MSNSRYIRGSNFERNLLDKLRAIGYDGLRSAGSHSSVDLLVWYDDVENRNGYPNIDYEESVLRVFAIQCKTSKEEKVNLTNLIWEDSIRELTGLSDNLIKVLCIKQYRKITTLVWNNGWTEQDIFNLNNLTKKGKTK